MTFYDIFKNSQIQLFDDRAHWTDEQKGGGNLVRVFQMASVKGALPEIRKLNAAGAGIFFQPNPSTNRKAETLTSIEWVYVDVDQASKEEQMKRIESAPIQPCMIIESQRSYHCYWWLEPMTKQQFDVLIRGLVYFFNGDEALMSPNEVLRLPGFFHMKNFGEPFEVKKKKFEPAKVPYEDMVRAFPTVWEGWTKKWDRGEIDEIKRIPIKGVLDRFGAEYSSDSFLMEGGEKTSAHINVKENYINRFSGKPPSGSVIDVVMHFRKTDIAGAIRWLKEEYKIGNKPIPVRLLVKKDDDRFTWGTYELDHEIPLLLRGRFVIVYGEAKRGKTTFIFDLACKNASLKKHRVLYLSLEMTKEDLLGELTNKFAGVTPGEAYDKKIPEYKLKAKERKLEELKKIENLIFCGMRWSEDRSWEMCMKEILSQEDLDLVIVDNLNAMSRNPRESEWDHQTRVAQEIAAFVTKYNVPLVLIHHTRKKSTDGTSKGADDMAGSGKLQGIIDCLIRIERAYNPKEHTKDDDAFYETRILVEQTRYWDECVRSIYFHKGSFYDYKDFKDLVAKDKAYSAALKSAPLPYKDSIF